MRLLISHKPCIAPVCRKCGKLMRFHSIQEVEWAAAQQPHIMIVFKCERCERWQAVAQDTPGLQVVSPAA